jgi:hypothetical protein
MAFANTTLTHWCSLNCYHPDYQYREWARLDRAILCPSNEADALGNLATTLM